MISFINDNGQIDYNGSWGLTKQAANIFNFSIKGDFSITFSIPNTSENRAVLGYYGPTDLVNQAFTKQTFRCVKDGYDLGYGDLIIDEDFGSELSLFFISGNSGWIKAFDFNVNDLENLDYTIQVNETTINSRISATTGIIFPIIDYCAYNGKGNGMFSGVTFADNPPAHAWQAGDGNDFFNDLFPAIYVDTLMTEIAHYAQIKFSGNLFDEPLYKALIATHNGATLKDTDTWIEKRKAKVGLSGNQAVLGATTTKIALNTVINQGSNQCYDATAQYWLSDEQLTFEVHGYIKVNLSQVYTVSTSVSGGGAVFSKTITGTELYYNIVVSNSSNKILGGETLEFKISGPLAFTINATSSYFIISPTTLPVDMGSATMVTRFSMVAPAIKAVELIKWLCVSFGCVASFDSFTQTLSLNILEKMLVEDAVDWSEFYVSSRTRYNKISTNNYIKNKDSIETQVVDYGKSNIIKYGDLNIETDSNVQKETTLYTSPFSATKDGLGLLNTSFIQNIKLEDEKSYSYSSVASGGAGLSVLTGTGFPWTGVPAGTIIRVVDDNGYYQGYYILSDGGALTTTIYETFKGTSTGFFVTQRATKQTPGVKMLICKPSTAVTDFSTLTAIYYTRAAYVAGTSRATVAYAYYSKPNTGLNVDDLKQGLSYGEIDLNGYDDYTMEQFYFSRIKKIINHPLVTIRFIIPYADFVKYNFGTLIYVKSPEITGYFLPQAINNYQDEHAAVEVDCLFI